MDRNLHLPVFLKQADALRESRQWHAAIEHYMAAERIYPEQHGIKHNIAVCYLALNDAVNALRYADQAIRLKGDRWQTHLVKAKSLSGSGRKEQAISLLAALVPQFPAQAEIRLELASLAIDELGDAALARELVSPLKQHPRHAGNACLTDLMASLYDSSQSAEDLSGRLRAYANDYLAKPKHLGEMAVQTIDQTSGQTTRQTSGRRRIGLMSPQFCCSPVYFFCIGCLRQLAQEFDLVFVNRGHRADWASNEFKAIASEWHEAAGMDSDKLAYFIARLGLEVLIDMGGWMDPAGLRAISAKPVRRIYKWVGGQSATTGIPAFDGFFTDRYQSDPRDQDLFAEPLIFLESGYVTYTPPAYMPEPMLPDSGNVLGIIANPVKISPQFLDFLKDAAGRYASEGEEPLSLRFIDRRYRNSRLRQRIAARLGKSSAVKQKRVRVEFVEPQSHRHYLEETAKLAAVIDTFPYSGGLTTVEALMLGVPCFTKAGGLFSGRHSYAHCMYAGMKPDHFALEKNLGEILQICHESAAADRPRGALIRKSSDRLNHQALAEEMAQYLQAGIYST